MPPPRPRFTGSSLDVEELVEERFLLLSRAASLIVPRLVTTPSLAERLADLAEQPALAALALLRTIGPTIVPVIVVIVAIPSGRGGFRAGALDHLVELPAVEPDTTTRWAVVDFDALAFGHHECGLVDWAKHGGDPSWLNDDSL